jgi:hypothetical protein
VERDGDFEPSVYAMYETPQPDPMLISARSHSLCVCCAHAGEDYPSGLLQRLQYNAEQSTASVNHALYFECHNILNSMHGMGFYGGFRGLRVHSRT